MQTFGNTEQRQGFMKCIRQYMTQVDNSPVRFAMFSGDVNQDGTIDATDVALIDNALSVFCAATL
jgi:hypothetical protein